MNITLEYRIGGYALLSRALRNDVIKDKTAGMVGSNVPGKLSSDWKENIV